MGTDFANRLHFNFYFIVQRFDAICRFTDPPGAGPAKALSPGPISTLLASCILWLNLRA